MRLFCGCVFAWWIGEVFSWVPASSFHLSYSRCWTGEGEVEVSWVSGLRGKRMPVHLKPECDAVKYQLSHKLTHSFSPYLSFSLSHFLFFPSILLTSKFYLAANLTYSYHPCHTSFPSICLSNHPFSLLSLLFSSLSFHPKLTFFPFLSIVSPSLYLTQP